MFRCQYLEELNIFTGKTKNIDRAVFLNDVNIPTLDLCIFTFFSSYPLTIDHLVCCLSYPHHFMQTLTEQCQDLDYEGNLAG